MGGSGASCYTTTCGDLDAGGVDGGTSYYIPDGGAAQPGCLLEGYLGCPAGQYCALGRCPNSTATYGYTCNADRGADCSMNCGISDCEIPGEQCALRSGVAATTSSPPPLPSCGPILSTPSARSVLADEHPIATVSKVETGYFGPPLQSRRITFVSARQPIRCCR